MKAKCPTGKIMYRFEIDAWLVAWGIYQKKIYDGHAYLCKECKYYHLTSRKGIVPQWLVDVITKKSPPPSIKG